MKNTTLLLPLMLAACSQAPSQSFDADNTIRIMKTLSADDMKGRRTGSEGNAKAQAFLKSEIAKLDVFDMTYETKFKTQPRPNRDGVIPPDSPVYDAVNLHGLIDTDDNDEGPLFVITAHYDHLGERDGEIYNGADDNASGSAALFAIAQSFVSVTSNHDVLFIWLDAEEMGLQGARHYVQAADFGSRAVFNLNLDMVSQNKTGEIYASGSYHTPALKPLVSKAAKGVDIKVSFGHDRPEDGPNDWTLQSDHGIFHSAGIPFLYFGVEDHPHYHRPTDEFSTIPIPFYENSLKLIVNTAHVLDENLESLAQSTRL
ncbi:M28 family peptidase [Hellea balneolensis]|uniref:M28 family peptidase n=1 Tax=Hellea balneolensis TaxID=287478 RepID=UPI000418BF99|nr:M28 family peptidase [Hellea balneolensis]